MYWELGDDRRIEYKPKYVAVRSIDLIHEIWEGTGRGDGERRVLTW